jgi:chromosome partitioning protein
MTSIRYVRVRPANASPPHSRPHIFPSNGPRKEPCLSSPLCLLARKCRLQLPNLQTIPLFHVERLAPSPSTRYPSQQPMSTKSAQQAPTPPGRVLAIVNQKGGVGKTTTAINLAAALALDGLPILLIDCDPQANTTGGLGLKQAANRISIYDLLLGQATIAEAIIPTNVDNLSLVPGSKNLIGANLELVSQDRREFRLRDAIQPIRAEYPFILLDCPPALDLLTLNALVAADGLLVPMQSEYFALEGISELVSTLDRVAQAFNPTLGLEGVVLTMVDDRTNLSQQVAANLRDFFKDKLFTTTIPRNIRLAEAPSHGQPVSIYDPRSRGAEAYIDLAAELLARNHIESPGAKRRAEEAKQQAAAAKSTRKLRLWPYNK